MTSVLGIHHVTAIATDPQRNVDFYAGVLGLRLVKRTVNFDDPQTYHLYYGDEQGTPGSLLTFFPWPTARRGRQGTGQVAVTSFAIAPGAVGFWVERLLRRGVQHEMPAPRGTGADAEQVIAFTDHDGLLLELVAHPAAEQRPAAAHAPDVPPEHGIRGFHGVTLWVERGEATERVLVDTLGFREARELDGRRRFAVGDGGPGMLVDVRDVGGFLRGAGGAGTVHHVAWRVADDAMELALRETVSQAGLQPTPVIDRQYFHSVYFREPGGVLYELATDPPGFTVDEPLTELGQQLRLPPQYEAMRAAIEAALPPLQLPAERAAAAIPAGAHGSEAPSAEAPSAEAPSAGKASAGEALGFVHRYVPRAGDAPTERRTLLLLHGTGGDEQDLLPVGRTLLPGAALLSPRGRVLEHGAPRFFRRLAEGVFDREDLARRTSELAEFVTRATGAYGVDRDQVVAVGFSNGANIAWSLLLRHPGLLRAAVLLSPMLPFEPESVPDLRGTAVFIGAGRRDPMVPAAQVEQLADVLRTAGADVTMHWDAGGHAVTQQEIAAARAWLARQPLVEAGLDVVTEASEESFPASDPPAWTPLHLE